MTRLMYRVPEAAHEIGVSPRVMERLIKGDEPEVESVKIGRSRLIPHDALVAYVKRLRETA